MYIKDYHLSMAVNKFTAKVAKRYKGPYIIERFYSAVTVGLKDDCGRAKRAHVS